MTAEIKIADSRGQWLTITTKVSDYQFDTVTYSDARGFTRLDADAGHLTGLDEALEAARTRREVCVLPPLQRRPYRILVTPSIRGLQPETRDEAERLMIDLFEASQAPEVAASSLLITHFARGVRRYPEPHIKGIFDGLALLANRSFRGLKVMSGASRAAGSPGEPG